MFNHYAFTGEVRYYSLLPEQAELWKVDAESVRLESEGLFITSRVSKEYVGKLTPLKGQVDAIKAGRPAPIKGPFDFALWKEPPHVALANLRDDPASVLRFTRAYGVLSPRYKGGPMSFPLRDVFRARDELRLAWEGRNKMFFWWLESYAGLPAELRARRSGLEIVVTDFRTLVMLMFAHDFWDERVKKCANPDCPAPYFLAVRKGQKFCSQKCAVLINVHRFRQREAEQRDAAQKLGIDVRMNERIRQSIKRFVFEFAGKHPPHNWRDWIANDAKVPVDYLDLAIRQGQYDVAGAVRLTKSQEGYFKKLEHGGK
jgi:hypothetical protein